MPSYGSHVDNQPLRYYNGKPIYLTLYLALALSAGTVVTLFLRAGGFPLAYLAFVPSYFLKGLLWQPFSYVFVNEPNFFTPLGLIAFYFWGVEVEKYLGRRHFLSICAVLLAVPVAMALLVSFRGSPLALSGDFLLIVGLLIAFATLYPDMDYIGGWVPLKWFAFASIAFGSISYVADHDWLGLGLLLENCAIAFLMVRSARGLFDFNFKIPWPRKKPRLRVVPRPAEARPVRRSESGGDAESEMDAFLDKIARSGLQSLSEAEENAAGGVAAKAATERDVSDTPAPLPAPEPKAPAGSMAAKGAHKFDPVYVNAMSHFYRGELGRIMAWRARLDNTTNWAITVTSSIFTVSFSFAQVPHIIFFFNIAIVWVMLWIEARRYRFYDAFRARVRMLEAHFLVPIIAQNTSLLQGDWQKLVCEDLLLPSFKISRFEAVARRLKRNYGFIFIIILVAWMTKIFLHAKPNPADPASRITDLRSFYEALSVGTSIPSWLVAGLFVGTFVSVIGTVYYIGKTTTGEISEFGAHRSLWRI